MRIRGGRFPKIEEFPWAVALQQQVWSGEYIQLCGGSIIDQYWVLTAAHCLNGTGAFRILAGTASISPVYYGAHNIHQVKYSFFYDNNTNNHDLAMLRLARPIDFSSKKNKIKLIELPDDTDDTYEERNGFVAGWGTQGTNVDAPTNMKVGYVRVLKKLDCIKIYENAYYAKLFLCGSKEEDGRDRPCKGDSGGGLVFYGTNKEGRRYAYLVGIDAYGNQEEECTGLLFTRVSEYTDWIKRLIKEDPAR